MTTIYILLAGLYASTLFVDSPAPVWIVVGIFAYLATSRYIVYILLTCGLLKSVLVTDYETKNLLLTNAVRSSGVWFLYANGFYGFMYLVLPYVTTSLAIDMISVMVKHGYFTYVEREDTEKDD